MALLGPNGGGKTTLLRALLGELRPLAGTLRVGARCATVPQTERSQLDYPVSALDVATMGALSRLPWWRRPGRREREAAMAGTGQGRPRMRSPRETFGKLSGGPAPACPDRAQPRPGRADPAARRALLRPRPPRLRAPGSADRDARGGGTGSDHRHPRPRAGPAPGQRALRQPRTDRGRAPRGGSGPRRPRSHLRRLDRRAARRGRRAILPPHHHHH